MIGFCVNCGNAIVDENMAREVSIEGILQLHCLSCTFTELSNPFHIKSTDEQDLYYDSSPAEIALADGFSYTEIN